MKIMLHMKTTEVKSKESIVFWNSLQINDKISKTLEGVMLTLEKEKKKEKKNRKEKNKMKKKLGMHRGNPTRSQEHLRVQS